MPKLEKSAFIEKEYLSETAVPTEPNERPGR
jgi:hypothetical protein